MANAYKAASELNQRMKLAEGREDFHTLSWLSYAHLMLGRFDEAKKDVDLAKQAADRKQDAVCRPAQYGTHGRGSLALALDSIGAPAPSRERDCTITPRARPLNRCSANPSS